MLRNMVNPLTRSFGKEDCRHYAGAEGQPFVRATLRKEPRKVAQLKRFVLKINIAYCAIRYII